MQAYEDDSAEKYRDPATRVLMNLARGKAQKGKKGKAATEESWARTQPTRKPIVAVRGRRA